MERNVNGVIVRRNNSKNWEEKGTSEKAWFKRNKEGTKEWKEEENNLEIKNIGKKQEKTQERTNKGCEEKRKNFEAKEKELSE
jgi:hypothetical protein